MGVDPPVEILLVQKSVLFVLVKILFLGHFFGQISMVKFIFAMLYNSFVLPIFGYTTANYGT